MKEREKMERGQEKIARKQNKGNKTQVKVKKKNHILYKLKGMFWNLPDLKVSSPTFFSVKSPDTTNAFKLE